MKRIRYAHRIRAQDVSIKWFHFIKKIIFLKICEFEGNARHSLNSAFSRSDSHCAVIDTTNEFLKYKNITGVVVRSSSSGVVRSYDVFFPSRTFLSQYGYGCRFRVRTGFLTLSSYNRLFVAKIDASVGLCSSTNNILVSVFGVSASVQSSLSFVSYSTWSTRYFLL